MGKTYLTVLPKTGILPRGYGTACHGVSYPWPRMGENDPKRPGAATLRSTFTFLAVFLGRGFTTAKEELHSEGGHSLAMTQLARTSPPRLREDGDDDGGNETEPSGAI